MYCKINNNDLTISRIKNSYIEIVILEYYFVCISFDYFYYLTVENCRGQQGYLILIKGDNIYNVNI